MKRLEGSQQTRRKTMLQGIRICIIIALGCLCSCTPLATLNKADDAVLALLSSSPPPEDWMPSAVWIELPEFTATFSAPAEIRALGEVLSSAQQRSSETDVRRHTDKCKKAGKLIVTLDGRDVTYNLYRSVTDSRVWVLKLPDRSHPGASLISLCDDGTFTEMLHKCAHSRSP